MFRLIKFAMYALLGYVLYEFYQGMTQEQGRWSAGGRGGRGSRDLSRALDEESGRMGTLTGTGRGMSVSAADVGGAEMRHTVGRGAVSGAETL